MGIGRATLNGLLVTFPPWSCEVFRGFTSCRCTCTRTRLADRAGWHTPQASQTHRKGLLITRLSSGFSRRRWPRRSPSTRGAAAGWSMGQRHRGSSSPGSIVVTTRGESRIARACPRRAFARFRSRMRCAISGIGRHHLSPTPFDLRILSNLEWRSRTRCAVSREE